jgi:hypothetical protein
MLFLEYEARIAEADASTKTGMRFEGHNGGGHSMGAKLPRAAYTGTYPEMLK